MFGKNGTLDYINNELSSSENDEETLIYDFNDILKYIKETTEFVKKELKRLKESYELSNKKFKIAVDVDDTILSTKELEEYYFKIFLKDNPDINPNIEYKWGSPILIKFWNEYREKMAFGKVKNGVADSLDYLIKNGYIVDLLTARPIDKYASLKKDLVMYFEENNVHYRYMHMGFFSKIEFLKEHNYNLLIDNDIKNIKEANDNGIMTILFGPYNSNYNGYQVSNWKDVVPLLEKILIDNKNK